MKFEYTSSSCHTISDIYHVIVISLDSGKGDILPDATEDYQLHTGESALPLFQPIGKGQRNKAPVK